MKFLSTLSFVALASSTRAFTVGPASRSLASTTTMSSMRSYSATSSALHAASPMDFAKQEIADNKIVVFSKSTCPFCKKTKALFQGMGVEHTVHELNEMDNGADIQNALLELTGQKTVPNVFVNGKHVGGNDDTQKAFSSGELQKMIEG